MILKYSKITRFLHWITAILVIALFVSGWYMVELDYYSNWYQTLPELHILGGVILLLLWLFVLLRLFRTNKNNFSQPHKPFERFAAQWVKRLFYVLVVVMVTTGYLIATGQGEALLLFETIKLPALSHFSATQIDTMGWVHEYTSYLLIGLVVLHAFGALKHHFIDKDDTLKRMT
jgi:cytochrome b561